MSVYVKRVRETIDAELELESDYEDWDGLREAVEKEIKSYQERQENDIQMIERCELLFARYASLVRTTVTTKKPNECRKILRKELPLESEEYKWFNERFEEFGYSKLLDKYMSDATILVLKTCLWCLFVDGGEGFWTDYGDGECMIHIVKKGDMKAFREMSG